MERIRIYLIMCAAAVALSAVFFWRPFSSRDTWEVLAEEVPERVSTKIGFSDANLYALKQTHEPLFRQDDGQNYNSRLLKSWSRDISYNNFRFCPDTSLRFDSATPFSLDFFYTYITGTTSRYRKAFSVSRSGDCFDILFEKPATGFLNFLTRYENSPTVLGPDGNEKGLGLYYVEKTSGATVVLKRKSFERRGYNTIVLRKSAGPGDPNLNSREISDFNVGKAPDWVKNEYVSVDNPNPISIVLVINHPDRQVRKHIRDCVDIQGFRKSFLPAYDSFYNIKTVLPVGLPGAEAGLSLQNCGGKIARPVDLWLYNSRPDNLETLAKYTKDLYARTNLNIKVKNFSTEELTSILETRSKSRGYNLIVFLMSSPRNEQFEYFDYFIGPNASVDYAPEELRKLYGELLREDSPAGKESISRNIEAGLAKESLVLPLLQRSRPMYYPKKIRNLNVGKGFYEYPEVGDFRW